MTDSFPRQYARTRGFNLGLPREFKVSDDGSTVAFLRSAAGDDPMAGLWVFDAASARERVVFDPASLGGSEGSISGAERDRRERAGERMAGVVSFAADAALGTASFVIGQHLYVADLAGTEGATELASQGAAFDPRPDPSARRVAYVADGAMRAIDLASGSDTLLASDDDPDITWGVAEFIAAEEMGRHRGYWWSPDGERLIAARVDERAVLKWHISSPADPEAEPRVVRFPQAGTANAVVTLHVLDMDGSRVDVSWDREAFEYVVEVSWTSEGPPLALVQTRDQRSVQVLAIDPTTGATQVVWQDVDERWIHITPGVPQWLTGGRLLTVGHRNDTRSLLIDGEPVTPPGLQVESVLHCGDQIWFRATDEPIEMHVWRLVPGEQPERISREPGIHTASAGGDTYVLTSESVGRPMPLSALWRGERHIHTFVSFAEIPILTARPTFLRVGSRKIRTAIFTPDGEAPRSPLPVLLDPYGGPHFGKVLAAGRSHLESQWLADQGFVVLVADGRGTPNRGVAWEQSVYRDYIEAALADQVEALQGASGELHYLDLTKVAIRGWSYGGYLACAALLRRPDLFQAGIAGAPVTDLRYYDTHYTERYLGKPDTDAKAYEDADVVKDAAELRGELLLIHGMADDNVHVVHSLLMSKALMEAGRRHSMIPLSGITHRPVDETAAENMLRIEVDFLRRGLGLTSPK